MRGGTGRRPGTAAGRYPLGYGDTGHWLNPFFLAVGHSDQDWPALFAG
ncbi:hypothetical protein [Zobellella taiwanensis]